MSLASSDFLQLLFKLIFFGSITGGMCAYYASRTKHYSVKVWFVIGFFFGLSALIVLFFLNLARKKQLATQGVAEKPPETIIESPQTIEKAEPQDHRFWYYLDSDHNQVGPVSFEKLKADLSSGEISSESYVWNDSLSDWQIFSELDEYKALT